MYLGKDIIGNPIINLQNGRQIGRVQDLYLDQELQQVAGLYVGSEGLLGPTPKWITAQDVAVFSEDTVLAKGDTIVTSDLEGEAQSWLRRDDLHGRPVDTIGGTKIGRIGDVILSDDAAVIGFSLDRVYVKGPVAERRALRRSAVRDVGNQDGSMTINLKEVEQQDLRVVDKVFFGEEVMLGSEKGEPRKSPNPLADGLELAAEQTEAGAYDMQPHKERVTTDTPEPASEHTKKEIYDMQPNKERVPEGTPEPASEDAKEETYDMQPQK
ncbi:MAG: PRC-barrel domain-containing protein [Anaerolineae bacterium]